MSKLVISIPCKLEYCSKERCKEEAKKILQQADLKMKESAVTAEIFAHAILFYSLEKFRFCSKFKSHLDPIDLEEGGDKWWRRIAYAIIYAVTPSL